MNEYQPNEIAPHVLRAKQGVPLSEAAVRAMQEREEDLVLVHQLSLPQRPYVFDYFGIRLPVTAATTAEELVKEIQAQHVVRALHYSSALPAKTREQEYSGEVGYSIAHAIPIALQCAQLWGNNIFNRDLAKFSLVGYVFEWNGAKVSFNPWAEPEAEAARVQQAILEALNAAEEAYRNSDEYKAYLAKDQAEQQALQAKVDKLMEALPETLKQPLPKVMDWAIAFAEGHDRRGVKTDGQGVADAFIKAGFSPNAYVGNQYREQLRQDKEMYGRYVIGQFLDFLPRHIGMPPILWESAKRFRAMA